MEISPTTISLARSAINGRRQLDAVLDLADLVETDEQPPRNGFALYHRRPFEEFRGRGRDGKELDEVSV